VDRLVLGFGAVTLVISADENDDTVNITLSETPDLAGLDISHLEPWRNLTGRPFGWGWVTVNQQGYCDGLLLSFGGIVPLLALNVIASSIKVGVITMVAQ
jgi:hypothetical protein